MRTRLEAVLLGRAGHFRAEAFRAMSRLCASATTALASQLLSAIRHSAGRPSVRAPACAQSATEPATTRTRPACHGDPRSDVLSCEILFCAPLRLVAALGSGRVRARFHVAASIMNHAKSGALVFVAFSQQRLPQAPRRTAAEPSPGVLPAPPESAAERTQGAPPSSPCRPAPAGLPHPGRPTVRTSSGHPTFKAPQSSNARTPRC
jgi:hypothetical protein